MTNTCISNKRNIVKNPNWQEADQLTPRCLSWLVSALSKEITANSLSKGDMTLAKGLRSRHGKDVRLHYSLGSPTSSKPASHNFCCCFPCMQYTYTTTCKLWFQAGTIWYCGKKPELTLLERLVPWKGCSVFWKSVSLERKKKVLKILVIG